MNKTRASAFILIASALWGAIALFLDQLTSYGFSSLQVVWLRVTTAALLMAIYVLVLDPTLFRIRLRDMWMFIGTGVVSLAFFNFCYFQAIELVSSSTAAVLLYTAPIFVMIMSAVFFKEKMTAIKYLALVITVVGCILVTDMIKTVSLSVTGVLFGLGAGIGYALYSIFSTVALRRYKTETITLYTFIFASVSVCSLCHPLEVCQQIAAQPMSLWPIVGIGLFVSLLPYVLYTKGLNGVPAGYASVMATLEPVVATVIGVTILGDELSFSKLIGIILIIGAIILISVCGNHPPKTS